MEIDVNSKDIVTAFIKGLNVIKAFDKDNPSMTLTDVAKKVDITRASARRLLLTLESQGYVNHVEGLFSLSPKIIELGYSYFASLPWSDLAYSNMKKIVDSCNLSCSISILDEINVICIMRIRATRILSEGIQVGTRLTAAYAATGRLFMSHMEDKELREYIKKSPLKKMTSKSITDPEVLYKKIIDEKEQGYQMVIEEIEDGLISLAVPIYNRDGSMMAAMNIGCQKSYKTVKYLKEKVLPMLLEASSNTTEAIKLLQY